MKNQIAEDTFAPHVGTKKALISEHSGGNNAYCCNLRGFPESARCCKVLGKPKESGFQAFVAQRIEHLTTDQKVGGSSPSKRTFNSGRDMLISDLELKRHLYKHHY